MIIERERRGGEKWLVIIGRGDRSHEPLCMHTPYLRAPATCSLYLFYFIKLLDSSRRAYSTQPGGPATAKRGNKIAAAVAWNLQRLGEAGGGRHTANQLNWFERGAHLCMQFWVLLIATHNLLSRLYFIEFCNLCFQLICVYFLFSELFLSIKSYKSN